MSTTVIIIGALFFLVVFVVAALMLDLPIFDSLKTSKNVMRSNIGTIVSAQRDQSRRAFGAGGAGDVIEQAADGLKTVSSNLTVIKRLKYAQWKIAPSTFHMFQIAAAIMSFLIIGLRFNYMIQFMSIVAGPLFVSFLLDRAVNIRFNKFDMDYSPFLLSLVGLLKTGMNPMQAIETSAQGLEETSLLRQEAESMMDRLRFGVPEDRSIGAFAEDVYHPEIELFVQALLLSRRVGGTLSDTLDRLSKQVRRRQYFRKSAQAAVSMQRGSIWFIVGILAALEVYLYFVYPEAVVGAIKDETGFQVWQFGIGCIITGIWWVRQVTKIKV